MSLTDEPGLSSNICCVLALVGSHAFLLSLPFLDVALSTSVCHLFQEKLIVSRFPRQIQFVIPLRSWQRERHYIDKSGGRSFSPSLP